MKAIGDVCIVVNGGTPKTGIAEYWGGSHYWVTPAEMGKRATPYIQSTGRTLTDVGIANSSTRAVPPKSIILSTRAPIGHVVINDVPMSFNQGCKGLVPNETLYYKWLYYFLLGNTELLNTLGTGATFKELSGAKLKEVMLPLPPLAEQKRIVAILDEAFAGIAKATENAERNLANVQELFDGYVQRVFDRGAEKWDVKTLSEVYDVRDGTHESPKYQDTGFPLVTSKNLKREGLDFGKINFIAETDYKSINQRSAVHKGDVLLAMIGTIGNPVLVEEDPNFAIKNIALFKVGAQQCGRFLQFYLGSKSVRTKMLSEAKGTTQKFVGLGYLRSFPICVPPMEEQLEIALKLGQVQSAADGVEMNFKRKIRLLDEFRNSLLRKAFSGQLASTKASAA